MKKFQWKRAAAWAGLPVLAGLAAFRQWGRADSLTLLLCLAAVVFGYLAAWWDLREKRVPNRLTAAMAGLWVLILVPHLFLRTEATLPVLVQGLLGAALGGGVFLLVYLISRRGLGGGDVKFMAAAGLYLGIAGVLPTMLCGSVLAALTGGILILCKRMGRKDSIPLIPFLYVGMLLTIFFR